MIKKTILSATLLISLVTVGPVAQASSVSYGLQLKPMELTKATKALTQLSDLMSYTGTDISQRFQSSDPAAIAALTSPNSQTPYGSDSCTAFVWQFYKMMGINLPPFMGMASTWLTYANSSLVKGTIAVFPPGVDGASGSGHVAVVTAVNSDGTFNIVEGNYQGRWANVRTHIPTAGVAFINPLTMKGK